MNSDLWEEAKKLSARNLITVIVREDTEEDGSYYVAMHPDLPGCMADGATPEEAKKNLAEARVDFIYYLLEDNLPVPSTKASEIESEADQAEYSSHQHQEEPVPHTVYSIEEPHPV